MKEKVTLSIVVPCYNAEKYIKQAIENIDNQTFTDWEAIFVNDGSSDNTGKILDELLNARDKYTVIHKENGGTSTTRNKGIEAASGKYITFMDVDDELDPQMYEKLVDLINETTADMGVCGYYFKVEGDENNIDKSTYLEKKQYPSSFYKNKNEICRHLVELWDSDMLYNVWNKIYRLDLIREKGILYRIGHVYTEDRVFNRAYIENCNSIAITDECLYYYVRERAGSTSEKYRDDYFEIRDKEFHELKEHFKNMNIWDEKAREYVCREFIERISGCIENIFHAEEKLTKQQKKKKIKEVINHPDVCKAVKYAKCRSKKMKILIFPIKIRSLELTYIAYKMVYSIRKKNPALFHKLKSNR